MSAFLAAFSPPPGPYALRCGCDVNCPYSLADIGQYVLSRNGRLALDSVLLNCQRKHILLVSGWSASWAAVYALGPTVYPGAMAILTGQDHNGMRKNANAIVREEDECTLGNMCSPAYRILALLNVDVSDEQSASSDVLPEAKTSLLD